MISNYQKCSVCQMIVLVWLMDDQWVRENIIKGICAMNLEVTNVTLVCSEEALKQRWINDHKCEWRTDDWLAVSLKSLPQFLELDHCIDTSGLSIAQIAQAITK